MCAQAGLPTHMNIKGRLGFPHFYWTARLHEFEVVESMISRTITRNKNPQILNIVRRYKRYFTKLCKHVFQGFLAGWGYPTPPCWLGVVVIRPGTMQRQNMQWPFWLCLLLFFFSVYFLNFLVKYNNKLEKSTYKSILCVHARLLLTVVK